MASLAAILAIGKPVALEASALERETLGFFSMTMIRPSAGVARDGVLSPPVSTPPRRVVARAVAGSHRGLQPLPPGGPAPEGGGG